MNESGMKMEIGEALVEHGHQAAGVDSRCKGPEAGKACLLEKLKWEEKWGVGNEAGRREKEEPLCGALRAPVYGTSRRAHRGD